MTEKTLTTENIKPALDALRGELAPWPVVAKKQDRLNTAQLNAANSGITSSLVAQIIANTAAIRALESAITGTGLRALVVASLPAVGTTGILYIVPVTTYDPETDADVVNYSNEYIWIPVEAGTASEGHYEQVGQTGIVINNGQLNITVNGTSVGTFTANQSGDTTAAITVPTNADYVDKTTAQSIAGVKTFSDGIVSNVTGNVTGDLTGTASKAIADEDGTSIKTGYVNVAGNQTVSGQKTWSGNQFFTSPMYPKNTSYEIGNTPASNVAIPIYFTDKNDVYTGYVRSVIYTSGRSATEIRAKNAFKNGVLDPTGSDISSNLNVEVQPSGAKTIYWDGLIRNDVTPYTTNNNSLGTSTNQWSSVYAQTYYYNGTAWGLDKSNTWTGNNEYKYLIGLSGGEIWFKHPNIEDITTNPNTDISKSILQIWNKGVTQYSGGITDSLLTDGTHRFTILCFGFPLNNYGGYYPHSFSFEAKRDGTASFSPSYTNASLGTSTNKWKTLNGVNPGALSLPDASNAVSIDTTNVSMDGTYTYLSVSVNGWLYIALKDTSIKTDGELTFYIGDSGTSSAYAKWAVNFVCSTDGYVRCFIPVLANSRIRVRVNPNGGSPTSLSMTIYPCLGNV